MFYDGQRPARYAATAPESSAQAQRVPVQTAVVVCWNPVTAPKPAIFTITRNVTAVDVRCATPVAWSDWLLEPTFLVESGTYPANVAEAVWQALNHEGRKSVATRGSRAPPCPRRP